MLLTADTLAEDDDNWRFAERGRGPARLRVGHLADGRTPMQVGRDHALRPEQPDGRLLQGAQAGTAGRYRTSTTTRLTRSSTSATTGLSCTASRRPQVLGTLDGCCPLIDPPHCGSSRSSTCSASAASSRPPVRLWVRSRELRGACVRGGQAQWALLLQVNRPRYLDWEAEEQKTRDLLGKDVSILRDRTGRARPTLTLQEIPRANRAPAVHVRRRGLGRVRVLHGWSRKCWGAGTRERRLTGGARELPQTGAKLTYFA